MIRRLFALLLLSIIAIRGSASFQPTHSASPQPCAVQDHEAWLAQVLKKMETIKPGMTRMDLLKVFKTEGRLSTGLRRTFVSRDCPYCKVVVEFKAAAQGQTPTTMGLISPEDNRDIIVKVSKPYLQFSIMD